MKKLFSIITALMLVLTLTACTEDLQPKVTELEQKITELEASIDDLTKEKEDLQTAVSEYTESVNSKDESITLKEAQIKALEDQIKDLQALIFDNVITFSIKEEDGSTTNTSVGYNDDYEGTLYDLLTANLSVTALDTEYGPMIMGIETLQSMNGSYIAFSVNGEMAMTGVSTTPFSNDDVFTFEIMWWDNTEKMVNDAINLFLENHASDYVNATSINYSVMSALSMLGIEEDYVTDTEVQTYVDSLTLTTGNDYFKAITILEAAGLDASTLYSELNEIAAPGGYGATGYQLTAFASNGTSVDFSAFETTALSDLSTNTPLDLGVDSGAITIIALSNYQTETGVDVLINDWVSYIKTNQLDTGAILDKDFGWGSTENSATMAQAVLGLVSVNVNPKGTDATSEDMTQLNYNLIASLLSYQTETGSFNWTDSEDLAFATPQALLALVAYQQFSNNFSAVNPYHFE